MRPYDMALDVAALASRREYLNLDKWLADHVAAEGADFVHAIIVFLDQKMENEKISRISDPAVENQTMVLSAHTITVLLRTLRNRYLLRSLPPVSILTDTFSANVMNESDIDYCLEVRNACLQIHPRLMTLTPGSDVEPGFTVVTYSADIEAEVEGIYKRMYDEHTSIEDVIGLLQR